MHDSIVLRSLLLPLLVAALGAGCSQEPSDNAVAIADEADASGATDLPANATPPPEIQAWMERLTVEHAYDPATGFIVAKETIALPPTLAEGPTLDDAVRQAGEDGRLVIAFATADRCAPCQQYKRDALNDARVIARLDDPRILATHVEVDRAPEMATAHLGSVSIPMTYALRDGRPVATLRGQRSADELLDWIEQQLESL